MVLIGLKVFFANLFRKQKKEDSPAARKKRAEYLSGKHIRYVIERKDNADEVIGREGHMNITPDGCDFAVTCGIETLFQVKIVELSVGELLSHDGVVLEGYDQISGRNRMVIAYYKYFR